MEPYYEAFACLAKSIRDDQEFQARALSLNAYYSVAELYIILHLCIYRFVIH